MLQVAVFDHSCLASSHPPSLLLTEIGRAASNTGNALPKLNDDKAFRETTGARHIQIFLLFGIHRVYIAFIFSEETGMRNEKREKYHFQISINGD